MVVVFFAVVDFLAVVVFFAAVVFLAVVVVFLAEVVFFLVVFLSVSRPVSRLPTSTLAKAVLTSWPIRSPVPLLDFFLVLLSLLED